MPVQVTEVSDWRAVERPLGAVILEEDTSLILTPPPEASWDTGHPIAVMTALHFAPEHEPGRVLVRPGKPLRLLAVVDDLTAEPPTCRAWIEAALSEALRQCVQLGVQHAACECLGCMHARFGVAEFQQLFHNTLGAVLADFESEGTPVPLTRITLVLPAARNLGGVDLS